MLRYLESSVNFVGLDESTQRDRSQTVEDHFKVRNGPEECHLTIAPLQSLLDRMIKEENGLKKRLVESLEHSIKQCVRLSKVFGPNQDNGIKNTHRSWG